MVESRRESASCRSSGIDHLGRSRGAGRMIRPIGIGALAVIAGARLRLRRGRAAAGAAGERARRVLHQLVALRARLHGQPDPGRQAERHRLRVRVRHADGVCARAIRGRTTRRPRGAGRQRRRRRRRSVESGPASVRQLQPARELKAAHPNLRLEMSIGGWTGSTYFSDVAATAARARRSSARAST